MKTKLDIIQMNRLKAFGINLPEASLDALIEYMPKTIKLWDVEGEDGEELFLEISAVFCEGEGPQWLVAYRSDHFESDMFSRTELIDALYHLAILSIVKGYIFIQ